MYDLSFIRINDHANKKYIHRIELADYNEVEPMEFEEISLKDQVIEAKLEWNRLEQMTEEELNSLKIEDIMKQVTITFEGSGNGDRIEVEPTDKINLIADETCEEAKEIFTQEWKEKWTEKFASKDQPKIKCQPINIKVKEGVTCMVRKLIG